MNLAHWLERTAKRHGNHVALLRGENMVADYAEFWRRAAGLATALRDLGIAPNDRVAVFARNCNLSSG